MAKEGLPSPEVLRQLLHYEPETGKLFWKHRPPHMFPSAPQSSDHNAKAWNAKWAGKEALAKKIGSGYKGGSINYVGCYAHRAVWAWTQGEWPILNIDHIDGDKTNNQISNLRLATTAQNGWNRGAPKSNTSGAKGVTKLRGTKWRAQITMQGNVHYLGVFNCRTAAALAYAKKSLELHGAFARTATK